MSHHLKRLAVPRKWALARKTHTFAPKPAPGPHAIEDAIPLIVALRDYLKVCDTSAEGRKLLAARTVLVDGAVETDPRRPLGFMDLVTLVPEGRHLRVLLDRNGIIRLVPSADAGWKLARIADKTVVAGGKVQLNLHDGRNIIVKEGSYRSGDVLKITVPKQEIKATYPLAPGHVAFITGGAHVGEIARIKKLEVTLSSKPSLVHVEGATAFQTIKPYVFVVGKDQPEIVAPEVSAVA